MVTSGSVRRNAVAGVLLVALVAGCSSRLPSVGTASVDDITISFTPSATSGPCVPASQAIGNGTLTNYVGSSPTSFTVVIELWAPLCEPINASAAVYVMPGGGLSWPQTLAASKPLLLQTAGTTVVTFAKGCDPAQFDVVTGNLPGIIQPTNAPALLFPGDINTAEQYWGTNCTTTTSSTTSTTSSTTSTTSTVPQPTIPLHNNTAGPEGASCPSDGLQYWHFVLVPNNNISVFTSITLNLGSATFTFTGAQIVPNSGQLDNVFVAVPAGYSLTSLVTAGSSATYSGATPNQFNLSGICS